MISIHALRGEGDVASVSMLISLCNFNPRPPWGGRHSRTLPFKNSIVISIHALRGEGDLKQRTAGHIDSHFNPRPPWGGRPPIEIKTWQDLQFQSTPSVGRATAIEAPRSKSTRHFNPRPPWGGRPLKIMSIQFGSVLFQSTPSVGRATMSMRQFVIQAIKFQSTPSVGRATKNNWDTDYMLVISIHALRGEGDLVYDRLYAISYYFNPRPPWGGRRIYTSGTQAGRSFQSTPSVGRATRPAKSSPEQSANFNPRPPWGGRRLSPALINQQKDFNPRPPWGGRPKLGD